MKITVKNFFKVVPRAKLIKKAEKAAEDAEIKSIFGDHEIYENAAVSPIPERNTPAPSPTGLVTEVLEPGSPDSPEIQSDLMIDETDVIKKFTVPKPNITVALEKSEVGI